MAENIEQAPDHVAALRDISKNIQQTLSSHLGEFRRTADANDKNILKVVKDLGNSVLSQKKQSAGLSESIEEVAESSNKIASKMDQMNSHLLESINIQQDLLAQMKNVFGGINSINNNWQQLSNVNNNTSIFGSIWNTMKSFGKGAGIMAGAGLGANLLSQIGDDGKVTKSSGNLAQNQQEAFKAAKSEGLSDKAAKILTANMSGESLAKPNAYNRDVNSRGEFVHMAQGIVQWDPQRSQEIYKQFGKYPKDMTVAEQTKAAIWEMKTKKEYTKAWTAMMDENLSDQERMWAVVKHYEKPAFAERDTVRRMGYLRGLKVDDNAPAKAAPEIQAKAKVTGDVKVAPEAAKPEAAPVSAPPATPNIPPEKPAIAAPEGKDRHPEGHAGIISGAAKQQYGGEGKVDKNALGGKDLSGVNKDLVSKLTAAASEFKAKTGQPVTVTSGYRSQEKQAQLYQAYITGKSHIPANPPGKSNHETGNAVDVSSSQAAQMDKMGILAKYGLARPLGERDPVHIQIAGTGTSQGSYGAGGQGDATQVGGKETATPGAGGSESSASAGSEGGGEPEEKPSADQVAAADLIKMAMGSYSEGAAGQSGMAGLMGGLGGLGGFASAIAPMLPGMMNAKMNDMAGIPAAQPVMAPDRGPIPVESPSVSVPANTIEQNAINSQIEEYNQRQKAAEVSDKTDELKERLAGMQQGEGGNIPGVDYNGPHDQEVISKWAERLGFGGSYFKEMDKIKIF